MKNLIKIACFLSLMLIGMSWGIQSHLALVYAQTNDDLNLSGEEDPLADDDPFAAEGDLSLEGDDPLADDIGPDLDSNITPAEEEPEYKIRTSIDQELSLIMAHTDSDKGGITQDETDKETNSYLSYRYQSRIKIQTSPYRYYFLRIISAFTQKHNEQDDHYTDDYLFHLREGYVNSQSGSWRYRLGAQIFKNGKVDYDSPLDVLNMKNQGMLDLMETEEAKDPTIALNLDWLGEIQTLSFYLAPFRQKTAGTEYSLYQKEVEEEESGDAPEDRTVLRPHLGLAYQLSLDSIDLRIGAFQWFDQDNTISWQDESLDSGSVSASDDYSQSYKEEDSTLQFVSLEVDATIGGFVFKMDAAYFYDKNIYHYYKDASDSSYFDTVKVQHGAVAFSIEKKFDTFFIMPVYSYRIAYDVSPDTHILTYENEVAPLTEKRNLEKRQVSLVLAWELTNRLQMQLVGSTTSPFQQDAVTNIWTYRSTNRKHYFQLKMHYSVTETIKMTDKKAETKRAAMKYTYQF